MKTKYKLGLAIFGLALTLPAFQNFSRVEPPVLPTAGACFSPDMNDKIAAINGNRFQLIHEAPTPGSGMLSHQLPLTSASYPGNSYSTGQVQKLDKLPTSAARGQGIPKQSAWLWANRCVQIEGLTPDNPANPMLGCPNKDLTKGNWYRQMVPLANANGQILFDEKGNPLMLRPIFSTLERANVCTQMQAQRILHGTPDDLLQEHGTKFGLKMISMPGNDEAPWIQPGLSPYPKQLPATALAVERMKTIVRVNGANQTYLADVCILEPATKGGIHANISGLTLDYEVWDDRPTVAVLSLFDNLERILGSFPDLKLIVFTNDLTSGGPHNGILPANAQEILSHVDYLAPLVWTGAGPAGPVGSGLPATSYRQTMMSDLEHQLEFLQSTGNLSKAQFAKMLFTLSLYYDDCAANGNHCADQLDDLSALRKKITVNTDAGFLLFKDGVKEIGDQACDATSLGIPVNQVMACLAFGRCGGDFNGAF